MSEPILENVIEEIVSGLVRFLLYGTEYQTFCHCKNCELEITATALNTLPNYYVVSNKSRDEAFSQLKSPESLELINKRIISAIHLVGKNHNHDS